MPNCNMYRPPTGIVRVQVYNDLGIIESITGTILRFDPATDSILISTKDGVTHAIPTNKIVRK